MDLAAFQKQIEASRAFEPKADGATFRMRLLTDYEWRAIAEDHVDKDGFLKLTAKAFRPVLDKAIVGWDGVTTKHVMPDAAEEALPYSADALKMLLDWNTDIGQTLAIEYMLKKAAREKEKAEALKNSSGASSGN